MAGLYGSSTYLDDLRRAASSVVDLNLLAGSRIAIAGATGLIGSFMVDTLAFASDERGLNIGVVAMGRSASKLERRFGSCPFNGVDTVAVDVSRALDFESRIDYVVHAASNAHPAAIAADPIGTSESNVLGALNLLRWGEAHGCSRLLYVSSGEVYGQMSKEIHAFRETEQGYVDPLSSRSCYPLSKRLAENICVSWTTCRGIDCVIARLCHTFGPTSTASDSRASEQFARFALAGNDVVLRSSGEQVRSYLHVADAVSGILSVMTTGARGHAYNVASPDIRIDVAGLARAFADAGGVNVAIDIPKVASTGETPITRQVLDPSVLMSLGWRPTYSLTEGVARTLAVRKEEDEGK